MIIIQLLCELFKDIFKKLVQLKQMWMQIYEYNALYEFVTGEFWLYNIFLFVYVCMVTGIIKKVKKKTEAETFYISF